MESTIIIALITSIASIIVASISLINNKINRKSLIVTNQALEALKFNIERKRIKFQILDDTLKNQYSELACHISHIQIFKDYLLLIENSSEESLDTETALSEINKRKENLFNCFEKQSNNLEKNGLKVAHSAKNLAFHIELKLIQFFKGKEFVNLNDYEKGFIKNSREKLNDFQNVLRDLRLNILADISKE